SESRCPAGREYRAGFTLEHGGEIVLELYQFRRAADQPRGTGAVHTPLVDGAPRSLLDLRVLRHREVVLRAEVDAGLLGAAELVSHRRDTRGVGHEDASDPPRACFAALIRILVVRIAPLTEFRTLRNDEVQHALGPGAAIPVDGHLDPLPP